MLAAASQLNPNEFGAGQSTFVTCDLLSESSVISAKSSLSEKVLPK
jgi:hypothetical protein